MIRIRRPNLVGWRTSHRRRDDGATESTQRAVATRPVADRSAKGAAALGEAYWRAVAQTTGGFVGRRESEAGDGEVELRSAIAGYFPTLAARPGAPAWTGEVYNQVQARLHARVSRSYFRRLARRAPG